MPRALPRAFFTRKSAGFTLIEVMIVCVIIAILAAIAVPNYSDYVRRGKIVEAVAGLAGMQTKIDQFFGDRFTYVGAPGCANANLPTSNNFTFSCTNVTASTYTAQAVGKNSMTGFTYTVTQAGAKASTVTGVTGWAGNTTCWVTKRGGVC